MGYQIYSELIMIKICGLLVRKNMRIGSSVVNRAGVGLLGINNIQYCSFGIFLFSSTTSALKNQTKQQQHSTSQTAEENAHNLITFKDLKSAIEQDILNHYQNYSLIKKSFTYYIKHEHFNRHNEAQLITILKSISKYPSFILNNDTLLSVYRIVCHNLHTKTVVNLNHLLMFVLVADQNASQSPIFLQFIKFYVQVPMEELKVKFQIDFQKLSLLAGLKQYISRLVQRGFLSRSPSYHRNINIVQHDRTLYLLRKHNQVKDSLMVKKLNYTIFMDIKEYYQKQMKQNLYHHKKIDLMKKFNLQVLNVMGQEIQMIHNEAIHLRQLYMKLYLTLPTTVQEQNQLLQTLKQQRIVNPEMVIEQLNVLKYKNVIVLYELAVRHVERMNNFKLDQIAESIDVVIQFMQTVQYNFKQMCQMQELDVNRYQFNVEELLIIMNLFHQQFKSKDKYSNQLVQVLIKFFTAFNFNYHFQFFHTFLHNNRHNKLILNFISKPKSFELLSLTHLTKLTTIIDNNPATINNENYITLLSNILKTVLSADYQVIGGESIKHMLQIYNKYILISHSQSKQNQVEQLIKDAQILRVFVMRFIADHHKQFKISQFQQIVILLIALPVQTCQHFDDQHKHYPSSIYEQIKNYLFKVQLLFTAQTKILLDHHHFKSNR